jgi:hypothetical protein
MAIQLSGSLQLTGSLFVDGDPVVLANQTSSLNVASASFASTASYADAFTVAGEIVAQTLNVQQVTSSVIYSSGSNVFGNSVSNTQEFTGSLQVSGSSHYLLGNVGIGTASPSEKLDVVGNAKVSGNLTVDTDTLFVDAANNRVGIGTSSPSQKLTVANGYGIFEGIKVGQNGTDIDSTFLGASSLLAFKINGSEKMRITSSGHLALGTTNANPLAINTNNAMLTAEAGGGFSGNLQIGTSGVASDTNDYLGFLSFYSKNGGSGVEAVSKIASQLDGAINSTNLQFQTESAGVVAERMRITSSGNVGIGTTSPTNRLQVQPALISFDLNGLSNGAIALTNNSNGSISPTIGGKSTTSGQPGLQFITGTNDTNTGADMSFSVRESDNTDFLTLTSSAYKFSRYTTSLLEILRNGNVGIGTSSPTYKMEIDGGSAETRLRISTSGTDADEAGIILANSTKTAFNDGIQIAHGAGITTFKDLAGEVQMAIDVSNSRVGIGTSSPAHKLDVQHTITSGGSDAIANFGTSDSGAWANSGHQVVIGGPSVLTYTGLIIYSDSTSGNGQVSFADGRGANDSWRGSVNYNHGNDSMTFATNAAERMRITSSGTLLLNGGDVTVSTSVENGTAQFKTLNANTDPAEEQFYVGNNLGNVDLGNKRGALKFFTGITERMRIDSSGNVLVATTSSTAPHTLTSGEGLMINSSLYLSIARSSDSLFLNRTGSNGGVARFYRDGGTDVGSISVTTTATAYNTSSDYRLKENVVDMTGALDRVDALRPSRFNFIADSETTVDGFIAHEVQAIVPEAVTGEKDAVDEEGNPIYQGIDQSKLVPLLTAGLQEAYALINNLKSRLEALEQA